MPAQNPSHLSEGREVEGMEQAARNQEKGIWMPVGIFWLQERASVAVDESKSAWDPVCISTVNASGHSGIEMAAL